MAEIDSTEMATQVGISLIVSLLSATLITFVGQPVWLAIEQAIGSGMYLLLLFLVFVWVGFGLAYTTEYVVPPMIVGSSIAFLSWPTVMEVVFDSTNDLLFVLGGMMWFGFTIGVLIPKAQARITSGER